METIGRGFRHKTMYVLFLLESLIPTSAQKNVAKSMIFAMNNMDAMLHLGSAISWEVQGPANHATLKLKVA